MKKIGFLLVIFASLFVYAGCSGIQEYSGEEISSIVFETVNYNGGATTKFIIDFNSNKVSKVVNNTKITLEEDAHEVIATFTDDEEQVLIDKCYTYGLFSLKEEYSTKDPIIDGFSWSLTINFVDGKEKKSTGENTVPVSVFEKCATAFYDICNEGILYRVKEEYYLPPNISFSFGYDSEKFHYSSNTFNQVKLANYKWNNFEKINTDIFLLNESNNQTKYLKGYDYKLTIYTSNYNYKIKFKRIELYSYDYDEKLSNEKLILKDGWINQKTINLELDKIYVLKLMFKNGDFAEYTFNTKSTDQKIFFGEYKYSIYNKGYSLLKINNDNTFELAKFNYFSNQNQELNKLTGRYEFEFIDGKEFLCMYANDNERIVFSFDAMRFIPNFEKTTFDITEYIKVENQELVYYIYQGK